MMRRLAAVVALLLLASCAGKSLTTIPASELPQDVYGLPLPEPQAQLPEEGTVFMVRDGRLVPLRRPLQTSDESLSEALMLTLLQGPPQGLRTEIPENTTVNEVEVRDGIVTVDLSEEFDRGATGRALALRVAQVVYSLMEDEIINGVRFEIQGIGRAVVNDVGEPIADRAVTTIDYANLAPREPA